MVVGMEAQGGLKQPGTKQGFDKLLNWQRGAAASQIAGTGMGGSCWEVWMQRGHVRSIIES